MTLPIQLVTTDMITDYLMRRRQALLLELDMLEDMLHITPRVSELRKAAKQEAKEYNQTERKASE